MATSAFEITQLRPDTMERVVNAIQKVQDRVKRASSVLEQAGLPYAVIGGNAVTYWVAQINESATRFTRDVDILIRRADLPAIRVALEAAGFKFRHVAGIDCFLDGPGSKFEDAVHLLFAGETVRPDDLSPAADVSEFCAGPGYRVLSLEALVRMKLTSYRDKDRTHLRDLIGVGLIDVTWCQRYPNELAKRLQHLFDTPGG